MASDPAPVASGAILERGRRRPRQLRANDRPGPHVSTRSRPVELAAGRAVTAALDGRPGPRLEALLGPAALELLRDRMRTLARQRNTFQAFLADVILMLPADAREDGEFVLAVGRFARDVWHS
jgi:hypothetical protein